MEALARTEHIYIFQRIFFDFSRMFIIPFTKMLVISNFDIDELLAGLPKACIIIAVLYSIPKDKIKSYYTNNPYIRTIVSVEFRYFKAISANVIKCKSSLNLGKKISLLSPNIQLIKHNSPDSCGVTK